MKTVIYIDMLIIQGVLINYTLLLCSARFAGINVNRWRILASAILGGLASCFILLPTPSILIQLMIKFSVTMLLLFVAFKTSLKGYIKGFAWYLLFNCFLAGLILIFYFTGGSGIVIKNMQLYFDISAVFLVVATLVLYICASAIRLAYVTPEQKPELIEMSYGEDTFKIKACYDSGFIAKDILNNAPLIILDYKNCRQHLPDVIVRAVEDYSDKGLLKPGASILPINSIGGAELTVTFYPLTIKMSEKTISGVKLCISKKNIDINGVNCLMSKEFTEVLNNAKKDKIHSL